jgi:ferritin-like protein
MNKNGITTGHNRTGIQLSPVQAKELMESVGASTPSSEGDEQLMAGVRMAYALEGETIGHVPPPATLKGAAGTVVQAMKGDAMSVFMDKLGERLAFERTGTRLYEALISKLDAYGTTPNGPTREDLVEIHEDEQAHYELVREAMEELGGDPTAMTPSADMSGVKSMGLPQVLADPRTTFAQCLETVLVAELVDNDGWSLLIALADKLGHEALAEEFRAALETEDEHLANVRTWVQEAALADAQLVP